MKPTLKAGTTSPPPPSPHLLVIPLNQPIEDTEGTGECSNTFAAPRYDRGNIILWLPCIADSQRVHTRLVGLERRSARSCNCLKSSGHVP
jgi:hypothetical protein